MEVKYFINEKNIKEEFGVYVSESSGIMDLPKIKEPTQQKWTEYHGTIVDLDAPRLEDREITLDCFISAPNQFEFMRRLSAFYAEFIKPGFKRLRIEVGDCNRPLVFDTYIKDGIKVKKQWAEGSQQGKFQIKLIEPNPQKKVLKFTATPENMTASLTITTDLAVLITWGDNEKTDEVFTEEFEVGHAYAQPGEYYICISGVISEIKNLTIDQNTEIVWEIL